LGKNEKIRQKKRKKKECPDGPVPASVKKAQGNRSCRGPWAPEFIKRDRKDKGVGRGYAVTTNMSNSLYTAREN